MRTVLGEIERAAAVCQPAQDDLVAVQHLLAVDAQVLSRFVWAAGNGESPRNEGRHIVWPAVLNR